MGADISKTSRSDINPEDIRLKELSPKSISKLRQSFLKNPSSVKMDRSKLISFTGISISFFSCSFIIKGLFILFSPKSSGTCSTPKVKLSSFPYIFNPIYYSNILIWTAMAKLTIMN